MRWLMGIVLATGLLALALPVEGTGAPGAAPAKPAGQGDAQAAPRPESSRDVQALIERLGHEDYRVRDKAYAALRRLGESARTALEKARNDQDPEIRWRSRRLLREMDRAPRTDRDAGSKRLQGGGAKGWNRGPGRDPFDWLEDPSRWFEGLDDTFPFDAEMRGLLDRLREQNEAIRKELRRFGLRNWNPPDVPPSPPGSSGLPARTHSETSIVIQIQENGETIRFESSKDKGAKATVTRKDASGNPVTETYEADDLETFRKTYPDLSDRLGLERVETGPDAFRSLRLRFGLPGGLRAAPRAPTGTEPPPAPRARLGILCDELPAVLRHHLKVKEGRGILVQEVEPGSLAMRLGLKPLDILLSLNDHGIGRPSDVRELLGSLEKGDSLRVAIIRSGQRRTLEGRFE